MKTFNEFIMACVELHVKTLYHTEEQGFGYNYGFQKFQTHPPN